MNVQNKPVEIPEYFSPNLKDLIIKMLEKDPKKRLSLKDAQQHIWLK
jgi:serine/threonine protein kinase